MNDMNEISSDMSKEIGSLALALSKAQCEMKPALKESSNPFFKSKYADLSSVWESARGPLAKNELAVIQQTSGSAESVTVLTTLAHSSGQWIRSSLTLKPVKADPQGVGSAISYARRYLLSAIVGGSADDDDGNAASGKLSLANSTIPCETKIETLTADEVSELVKLLKDHGASEEAFCKSAKVSKLSELPRSKFENAKAYISTVAKPKVDPKPKLSSLGV